MPVSVEGTLSFATNLRIPRTTSCSTQNGGLKFVDIHTVTSGDGSGQMECIFAEHKTMLAAGGTTYDLTDFVNIWGEADGMSILKWVYVHPYNMGNSLDNLRVYATVGYMPWAGNIIVPTNGVFHIIDEYRGWNVPFGTTFVVNTSGGLPYTYDIIMGGVAI